MNVTAAATLADEVKSFDDFFSATKRRDAMLFWFGFFALIVVFATAGVVLYRSFASVDHQLEEYKAALKLGQREVQQLNSLISTQQQNLDLLQRTMKDISQTGVRTLILKSAEHRKEIDRLNAGVKCLKSSTSPAGCP